MSTSIAPKISKIVLANGLHIFVLPQEFSSTFAGYYHFDVGSAHDPLGRSGIAHLLEHMMFKGTKRIGTTRANEYSELVTRAGGHGMNATTSYDMTRYYVQLPSHQLEMWFSLEAQRLKEPVFREFEPEREVVLEERRLRVENQAEGVAYERHRRLLYPDHPYGVPVIGWPEDIRALKRSDAQEYFHTWYSPSNCTMVLVGDLNPGQVETLADKYLGAWETQDLPERPPRPVKSIDSVRRDKVEFDALGHLRMAWITVPEKHPDHDKLSLLSAVLGELNSSRLTRRLVHEREIAAAVISFAYGQHESGSFNIIARPTSKSSLSELESEILQVVHELGENGVEQEELDRARIYLEANRTQRLYSKLSLAMDIGAEVALSEDPARLDTYEERLAAITPEQVNELARRWLAPEQRCVAELERAAGAGAGNGQGLAAEAGESSEHRRQVEPSRRGAAHSEGFVEMLALIDSAPRAQFHVPAVGSDVRREEISAGPTLFLKEDHDLPGVRFNLHFKGGSNSAPLEILSAYALAGALWQEGGAGKLDPSALERAKEDLGITMSMRPGPTGWQLSLWTLSRNLDPALKLLRAMLREPRLDSTRLG
ncbi:MAG TPA: pitrilysin family protein, partial [Candidatus Krumholzibacteria bacterium]|nr:pitrilysin family protein [Candidatus Krumholzibacteria bacterium]